MATGIMLCLLAGLASCTDGGSPIGGGGGGGTDQSAIILRGNILDEDGVEVFGSIVSVTVYEYAAATCVGEPLAEPFEAGVNEGGGYYLLMTFARDEFRACLDIEVIPPEGSPFRGDQQLLFDLSVNEIGRDPIHQIPMDFVLVPEGTP